MDVTPSSAALLLTGSDAKYFELVRGTVLSIRRFRKSRDLTFGFLDLGCTPEQLAWLYGQVDLIHRLTWPIDVPGLESLPEHVKGMVARPFFPRYFPGYDSYLWIDADAWVQDWRAIELFLAGARKRGLAIVAEVDRGSRLQYGQLPRYWEWARGYYRKNFGAELATQLCHYPMLNAGVFAATAAAPHWQVWAHQLEQALRRTLPDSGFQMNDQFALNAAIYAEQLLPRTELLPAWCNWTCHFGLPAWDPNRRLFVEPHLPHTPIGVLHLTSRKYDRETVRTTTLQKTERSLRFTPPVREAWDYVSPGLPKIFPDRHFPNMVRADMRKSSWPHLRRDIPHLWYVDRRAPDTGFVSRDEAHILYNTALRFHGRRALEIGCWFGWSACHLALAGVRLDVVDPALDQALILESVRQSLAAAGVLENVELHCGGSPQAVEALAAERDERWSLFFIDGDHDAPGPLRDAEACARHAAPDAAILFHDLASPDVAQGLDYLRDQGWRTMIYQTAQIMGIAWRGSFTPVHHLPDPFVAWTLPDHLRGYEASPPPETDYAPETLSLAGETNGATLSGPALRP